MLTRPIVRTRVMAGLAVLVLTLSACGGSSSSTSSTTSSTRAGAPTRSETFTDSTRGRTLPTTLVLPERTTPSPLIVFLHGYDQAPSDYQPLLQAWAEAGFVVAAPELPKTHHGATGGLDATDYRNQPADVRFLIDELLRATAADRGPLAGRIDPARVGVAGHSLGAEVVIGMLNNCCFDSRVRAAVSLAGSEFFEPDQPAFPSVTAFAASVPVLFVHGDADRDNPYARSQTAFARARAPKFLETLVGADHRVPYQSAPARERSAQVVAAVTVDFFQRYLEDRPDALDRMTSDGNVAGIARLEATP